MSNIQYCINCMDFHEHSPKMSALKEGKVVCSNCSSSNPIHDIDELYQIYNDAWNDELNGTFVNRIFGDSIQDQYRTSAHNIGSLHGWAGDDVSSVDLMSKEEIIKEIIELAHRKENI